MGAHSRCNRTALATLLLPLIAFLSVGSAAMAAPVVRITNESFNEARRLTDSSCQATCFGMSCDYWTEHIKEAIEDGAPGCEELEEEYGCDCAGCSCLAPTSAPTFTTRPSISPVPTSFPSQAPTSAPSVSREPTHMPTRAPTAEPSISPAPTVPTFTPTAAPSVTSAPTLSPQTITSYTQLDAAIRNMSSGDSAAFGVNGSMLFTDYILIIEGKSVHIAGPSTSNRASLSGGGVVRLFRVTGGGTHLTLECITVMDGFSAYGGGFYVKAGGSINLVDSVVSNCIGSAENVSATPEHAASSRAHCVGRGGRSEIGVVCDDETGLMFAGISWCIIIETP